MTNKLYDSKGQLIGYIRTVEKNMHDDLMKVILSTGHELVFGPCDLTSDRDGNWRIRSGALYPRCEGKKTDSATNTAAIKDVIFAPPATIVYWSDGSKTVVKCSETDVLDPDKVQLADRVRVAEQALAGSGDPVDMRGPLDAALVRAKAITAGITAEVGGKDETGIVDIDFLALGVHKYQSPFYLLISISSMDSAADTLPISDRKCAGSPFVAASKAAS